MLAVSELVLVTSVAAITAVVARFFLTKRERPVPPPPAPSPEPLSFLFDDGVLHHASTAALKKFAFAPGIHVWDDLRDGLLRRFPDFPKHPGTGAIGNIKLHPGQADDPSEIEIDWRDGMCWVHLNETAKRLLPQDSSPLERCARTMVQPAWEADGTGHIGWQNDAFTKLVTRLGTVQGSLPFVLDNAKDIQRCSVISATVEEEWFEIVTHSTGGGHIYHATQITALVKAEEAQRTFVQTLAKTFAHLPVGLAIFDERGQLGIFNPALVDLSGLQASFLATQPTMLVFFDALRENRRMPEPKNYLSWRQDIADVITAASGWQYRETWTLEDGRTYAVQGRPHPDGSTAFLIEDISAEITLSRSYRAEIEQFEALLDNVDDALVVFSSTGVLTFCNNACRKMWGQNPEAAFADVTIRDAVKVWDSKVRPGTDWAELISFATTNGLRANQTFDLYLSQGEKLRCALSSLTADATMIRFSLASEPVTTVTPAAPTPV